MTSTTADEKRQDERRVKELREFQRGHPANKRCFDCNEMMPQYVCLDFNTFVCTSCSGIHREFAHRVKSISMSKFTETEVKNMLKFGGNEAAQKYWRAKFDSGFRPHGSTDGEKIRNFIRLTYIDRRWVYESPRDSKRNEDQPQSSPTPSKSSKSKKTSYDFFNSPSPATSSKPAASFDAFGSNDFNQSQQQSAGFAQFGDFSNFSNNTKQQNDFGNFSGSSSSAGGFADFDSFEGSSATRTSSGSSFKIAPPSGARTASRDLAPVKTSVPAPPSDFMAFSPDKPADKDPFGFDSTPTAPAARPTSVSFDAFGSAPAPSNASAFDAFGAPSSTKSAPAFDAFCSAPQTTPATSGFDAFGSAAAKPASTAAAFDAFGSPATRPTSTSFDAFGAAPATPASPGFGNFTSASSSASDPFAFSPRTSSGNTATPAASTTSAGPFGGFGQRTTSGSSAQPTATADPFGGFGQRTASGNAPKPAAPVNMSDPFSAFSPRASSGSNAQPTSPNDPFGSISPRTASGTAKPAEPQAAAVSADPFAAFEGISSGGSSIENAFGSSANSQQSASAFGGFGASAAPSADPFATAGPSGGSGSKNNSFGNANPAGAQQGFGGGMAGFQNQPANNTQPWNASPYGGNASGQFGGHPPTHPAPVQQHQMFPGQGHSAPQQNAQQWNASPYGQQQQQQPVNAAPAPPAPAKTADAIKDPFAALNIGGDFGLSNMGSTSRNSSSGSMPPHPPMPGFTAAANPGSKNSSFTGVGQPAATGSRGNSFGTAAPQMNNHFGMGGQAFGAPMQSQSPAASFSYPAQQSGSKNNSFTQPVGGFGAAPTSSAAASNPFDMF